MLEMLRALILLNESLKLILTEDLSVQEACDKCDKFGEHVKDTLSKYWQVKMWDADRLMLQKK